MADCALVGETRGVGFIGALELVKDKNTRERYPGNGKVGTICRDLCIKNGLVMRATGDTMLVSPPLTLTREQVDELIEKARKSIDETLEAIGNGALQDVDE